LELKQKPLSGYRNCEPTAFLPIHFCDQKRFAHYSPSHFRMLANIKPPFMLK